MSERARYAATVNLPRGDCACWTDVFQRDRPRGPWTKDEVVPVHASARLDDGTCAAMWVEAAPDDVMAGS